MKKTFLLFFGMLCHVVLTLAQNIVDNAVTGTGLNQHTYVGGGWLHGATTPGFYNSTFSASTVANAYLTFTFEGNKVEWFTEKKNTHGIAAISIDGGPETLIDLYSTTEQHILVYTSPSTLTQGTHTVKVRATGTKNPASTNYWAIHDYFITYQNAPGFARPLIHLKFNEYDNYVNNPRNSGTAAGFFTKSLNTPSYAPGQLAGATGVNWHSLDFGTTPGNFYVESSSPINELKNLNAFTLTGWVNCKSSAAGSGGNRIISWINNGGEGVDLVYQSNGSLRLGVDGWPDNSPAFSSSNKIIANAQAPRENWVFFAVTYLSNGQVQFYFGNEATNASLDVTKAYPGRGATGSAIGKLAIGAFNSATRNSGTYDRMFRGLIDDIQVHGSVLTLQDIIAIQRHTGQDLEAPRTPLQFRLDSKTDNSVTIKWSPSTDNVGVLYYIIYNFGVHLAVTQATSFTLFQQAPGTAFSFSVRAIDAADNLSSLEDDVTVTTNGGGDMNPPSTPNLAVASKTDDSIILSWNLSSDNVGVKEYYIFLNNSFWSRVPNPSSGVVSNLNPGSTYDIYIKAIDAAGNFSLPSNTLTVTLDEDTTPPSAPDAKLAFRTSTSISLQMSNGGYDSDIVRYVVSANSQQYNVPYLVNATSNFTVPNLAPGTTYNVTVQAQDAAGNNSNPRSLVVTTLPAVLPLIRLVLNEVGGSGATVVQNYGSLNSSFVRSQPVPYGSDLPIANGLFHRSFAWGTTPGNYYVESTGVIDGLKNLSSFTLVGWVNNNSTTTGSGGNRIISWINNGGDGVDLVYQSNGSLRLGVDGWPDNSPAFSSTGKVRTTSDGDEYTTNWTFFAVTYQSNGQVQFYFGNYFDAATLDVTRTYPGRGNVGSNIGRLALGNFNSATRHPYTYDRMFRGFMADIQIYGSVLSLPDILRVQGRPVSESFATRSSMATARFASEIVEEESEIKDELYQNYPNPYSDETIIGISLRRSTQVANIMLMDLNGRELKNIEVVERGKTSITINGGDLHAGMYFYRLMTDGQIADTKRMVLTK
jgi:chitodextrinase